VHPAKTYFFVLAVVLPLVSGCLTALAQANPAAPPATVTPQLDHFDDPGLRPLRSIACRGRHGGGPTRVRGTRHAASRVIAFRFGGQS
jgi:hypothetical protein